MFSRRTSPIVIVGATCFREVSIFGIGEMMECSWVLIVMRFSFWDLFVSS